MSSPDEAQQRSRPKYALIIATPLLKIQELEKLKSLGFVSES